MKKIVSAILIALTVFAFSFNAYAAKTIAAPSVTVTVSKRTAKITYKKVKGAKKYEIYMKRSGGSWRRIAKTSKVSYNKKSLNFGTKYYFKVRAVSGAQKSKFSSTRSITTTHKPVAKTTKAAQNSETVYVTETGEKYHRSGCRYLSDSKISISLSSAKSSGYTPCSVCY